MSTPSYAPDLSEYSLQQFKDRLKSIRLFSTHRLLLEDIDRRFEILEQHGIENLAHLHKILKTKTSLHTFAAQTGLPPDYLIVLRREVNGLLPKQIALKDFPGVNPEAVLRLDQLGIKTTAQLFPHVLTPQDRKSFADLNQLALDDLLLLTKLTDLARLKWTGPVFARLLAASEFDTVEKILDANVEDLYRSLLRTNTATPIYKGSFNLADFAAWLDTVRDVPRVIQYV